MDECGGEEEGGEVRDGFWCDTRDGDLCGECWVAEHGVVDSVIPFFVGEEGEVHPVLETHCPIGGFEGCEWCEWRVAGSSRMSICQNENYRHNVVAPST